MPFISLQPDQTFHEHLVQGVFTCPARGMEMANIREAVKFAPRMIFCSMYYISVSLSQLTWGVAHYHRGTAVETIIGDVNPERVALVVAGCHSHFNFRVACWISPRHSARKVPFKQLFLHTESFPLNGIPTHRKHRCWIPVSISHQTNGLRFRELWRVKNSLPRKCACALPVNSQKH